MGVHHFSPTLPGFNCSLQRIPNHASVRFDWVLWSAFYVEHVHDGILNSLENEINLSSAMQKWCVFKQLNKAHALFALSNREATEISETSEAKLTRKKPQLIMLLIAEMH